MNLNDLEIKSSLQTIIQKVFRNEDKLNSFDFEMILVKLTSLFSNKTMFDFQLDISLFLFSKIANYGADLKSKLIGWNENKEFCISILNYFINNLLESFEKNKKENMRKIYLVIYLLFRFDIVTNLITEIYQNRENKFRRVIFPFILISSKSFVFNDDYINLLNESLILDNEVIEVLEQPLKLEIFNSIKSIRRSILYLVGHISDKFLESISKFCFKSIKTQNLLLDLKTKSSKIYEDVFYQNNIESIGLLIMIKTYFINKNNKEIKDVSSFCSFESLIKFKSENDCFLNNEIDVINSLPILKIFDKKESGDILVLQDIMIRNSKIEKGIFESIFMNLILNKNHFEIVIKYIQKPNNIMLLMIKRLLNMQKKEYFINYRSLLIYLSIIKLYENQNDFLYLDLYAKRILVNVLEIGLKNELFSKEIIIEITKYSLNIQSPFKEMAILNCLNSSLITKNDFIKNYLFSINNNKEYNFLKTENLFQNHFNKIITFILEIEIKIKKLILIDLISENNYEILNNECKKLMKELNECLLLNNEKKIYLKMLLLEKQLGIVSYFGKNEKLIINAMEIKEISIVFEDLATQFLFLCNLKVVSMDKLMTSNTFMSFELIDLSATELGDILIITIKCLSFFRNFGGYYIFRSVLNMGVRLIEGIQGTRIQKYLFIFEFVICFQNFESCKSRLSFYNDLFVFLEKNQDFLEDPIIIIKLLKIMLSKNNTSLIQNLKLINEKVLNIVKNIKLNTYKEDPSITDILNLIEILIYKCCKFKSRLYISKSISEIFFLCKIIKTSKHSRNCHKLFIEVSKEKNSKESLTFLETLFNNGSISANILYSINHTVFVLCKIMFNLDFTCPLFKALELGLDLSIKNKIYFIHLNLINMKFVTINIFDEPSINNSLDIIELLKENYNSFDFNVKDNSFQQIFNLFTNSSEITRLINNLCFSKIIYSYIYNLLIFKLKTTSKCSLIMYLDSFKDVFFGSVSSNESLEMEINELALNRRISYILKNTDSDIFINLIKGKSINYLPTSKKWRIDFLLNLIWFLSENKSIENIYIYQKIIIDFILFQILNMYHQYSNSKEKNIQNSDFHIFILHIIEILYFVSVDLNLFFYSKLIKHAYLSCLVGLENREEFLYKDKENKQLLNILMKDTKESNINILKCYLNLSFFELSLTMINQEMLFNSLYKIYFQENKVANGIKRKTINRLTLKNSKTFCEIIQSSYIIKVLINNKNKELEGKCNMSLFLELIKDLYIKELIFIEHFDWIFNINRKLIFFGCYREEFKDLSFYDVFPSPGPIVILLGKHK